MVLAPPAKGNSHPLDAARPRVSTLPLRGRRFRGEGDDVAACAAQAWTIPCFVAGHENRLLAAAFGRLLDAERVRREGPGVPAPLLLVGPSGCGKTHLARGLAEAWHAASDDGKVAYMTASDFRRQVAAAIADRAIDALRSELRRCRLLAIDDVHRLGGDGFAAEELIHTIDALEESGGVLLAASSRPPSEVPRLGRTAVSRLVGGTTLQIAPLGEHARGELLRLALAALGVRATDDALQRLARHAPQQAPGVFRVATQLRRQVRAGATLDDALAEELLRTGATAPSPPLADIVDAVCEYYGIPKSVLTSASRKQSTVFARAVAIYLARELTPLSYDQIGRRLGGRDHTTVLHNYRRIAGAVAGDRALQSALGELRHSILNT